MLALAGNPSTRGDRAANDNPPGKRIDRWRLAIDATKAIMPKVAVWIATQRLRGRNFEEVMEELLNALTTGRPRATTDLPAERA